jgi:peptidoglycan-associated lipoprotein
MEGEMSSKKVLHLATLVVLVLGLSLTGCSKKTVETAPEVTGVNGAEGAGTPESLETEDTGIMEGRTSGPMVPVYFGFDSSKIEGEQVQRIETNAEFIKKNPSVMIRIEGNCDPRGTQEYNLALGERRAQNAKRYLVNLGVNAEQLNTVSFGEEKLLLFGHDEISWAQNRRDDFVIVK